MESFRVLNRKWRNHLAKNHGVTGEFLDSHPLTGTTQLRTFENIRENESLRPQFRAVHNLALVALVSVFSSAARYLFRALVAEAFEHHPVVLQSVELKLRVGELISGDELSAITARALEDKEKLSFQDMKSMGRAFKLLLAADVPRDKRVNNIIVAQACRHALVHADGLVTDKVLHQIRDATPRTLKPELTGGETIEFSPSEIESVGNEMGNYLACVVKAERRTR